MPRILITLLFTMLAMLPASAQGAGNQGQKHKELMDFKIKYLMQEVDLPTDKQAEFEKLYRAMEDEKHRMFTDLRNRSKALKKSSTDAEVLAVTDLIAASKQKEGEIEHRYYQKFKKLLTARQLFNLKSAEFRFNRKVMELRGRKDGKKTK